MRVQSMFLDPSEGHDELKELDKYLSSNKNIIVDRGAFWYYLYQVTPKQVDELKLFFEKANLVWSAYQLEYVGQDRFPLLIHLRQWLKKPELGPGRKEKERILKDLPKFKDSGEFDGISAQYYEMLIENLKALPDKEDLHGYTVRYQYCVR